MERNGQININNSSKSCNEQNDCVVRAITKAFDISYNCAHKFVAKEFKRKPRKSTYGFDYRILSKINVDIRNSEMFHVEQMSHMLLC